MVKSWKSIQGWGAKGFRLSSGSRVSWDEVCKPGAPKRWDEARWVKGSLVQTLPYWRIFTIPHLPSSHLLSPLVKAGLGVECLEFGGFGV